MTSPDFDEIADHEAQAREFLVKSREYLAQGNLHQASEKGWGAAAHIAKAVAVAQGWRYINHSDFSEVLYQARKLTGNSGLNGMRGIANELHINYYQRKMHLNAESIGEDLDSIAELVEILYPLTGLGSGG